MLLESRFWRWSLLGIAVHTAVLQQGSIVRADELNPAPIDAIATATADGSEVAVADAALVEATATAVGLAEQVAAPTPAPVAKKKTPPVFPGPKVLPPTGPWKPLFFDNDFSYKKDPNHEHLLGEELKDIRFGFTECDECFSFSTGGEIRHRYMNEDNRLRPGGPAQADNHLVRSEEQHV